MKINGHNPVNFNPYKNALQKQMQAKKELSREDKVEISSAAKQLQESDHLQEARSRYILEIKQAVESGEYKVDPYKTAEKMIEYWTKK